MTDLINALQVGLTVTFIAFCIRLLMTWWGVFLESLGAIDYWQWWRVWRNDKAWTAEQWLVVGIVSGFAGNVADNLYWGVTWLAVHYHSDYEFFLMKHGPLSNVFVRQTIGIWAVYCHLKAAKLMNSETEGMPANLSIPTRRYFLAGMGVCLIMLLTG